MNERLNNFKHHVAQTSPYPMGIDVDYAQGIFIYDKAGKSYIDMISGIAVNNLGHQHPKVLEAIKTQLERHMHVMVYGEYIQDAQLQLCNALNKITPNEIDSFYFVNSGTEAVEAALKLAKRVTGRHKIVSFKGAYHGSTHGSLSVSGNEYKKYAVRPLLPDIHLIRFNMMEDLSAIDEQTSCVIIEPIQGDAGVRIPSITYMTALRKKCDATGALLIVDEIQTGFGRTAKWFAFEHFDIIPDIITMAKGLGGGMPIGCLASSYAFMEQFTHNPTLGHITTFGGHPVNCAAAAANILAIEAEIDFNEVERKGAKIELLLSHHQIKSIRRKGLLFAIDLNSAETVQHVVETCLSKGLISFWFLSCPNAFRIAPPLNISDSEIDIACNLIIEAIDSIPQSC